MYFLVTDAVPMVFQLVPARGRPCAAPSADSYCGFNSRPHEGGDKIHKDAQDEPAVSTLAPVRGATQRGCRRLRRHRGFNSRPREGGDHVHREERRVGNVSTLAPVRGATG